MKNKKSVAIIWLMILLFLASGRLNIDNTFLCYGEDGHIRVEYGNCTEEYSSKTFDLNIEKKILIHKDNCGQCNDIPLFTNNSNYFTQQSQLDSINFDTTSKALICYYHFKTSQPEPKPDKLKEINLKNSTYKLSYINTSTTVLLN